ncbi:hypothetical protein TNCV_2782231 [Trichonephila clavipes]|nr:hypothetical protein TNCV_2782231 [Trichonephila clavipes]
MTPNTLRIVHTEYILVKSVGPKVLWVVAAETTSVGDWRIFPSPPVPCLIVERKIDDIAIYYKEVHPVSQSLETFIPFIGLDLPSSDRWHEEQKQQQHNNEFIKAFFTMLYCTILMCKPLVALNTSSLYKIANHVL